MLMAGVLRMCLVNVRHYHPGISASHGIIGDGIASY
jgi:hypothetical protein